MTPANSTIRSGKLVVLRGSFDVVDDELLRGNLLRLQLESELFLERGEEGRQGRVGCVFGGVTQGDVEGSGDAGLVNNGLTGGTLQHQGKKLQGDTTRL